MFKRIPALALLVAAALLAVPAVGQAHKTGSQHNHGANGKANGKGKSCAKKPTVNKGFVVKGTLVSATADNPLTANDNEANVVITVTGANRHARVSGELTDQNPSADGVQVAGGSYTVDATNDAFSVQLSDYTGTDTPSAGDAVRIVGKVAVTRKKCATAQQDTAAERYGDVNIRRVKIADRDADV